MKFIVDENLPMKLVELLQSRGYQADHVRSLSMGRPASDGAVVQWADDHDAVVVSKDDDFRLLQVARGRPKRLLLVATGNISNRDLVSLYHERGDAVERALGDCSCVALGRHSITVFGGGD